MPGAGSRSDTDCHRTQRSRCAEPVRTRRRPATRARSRSAGVGDRKFFSVMALLVVLVLVLDFFAPFEDENEDDSKQPFVSSNTSSPNAAKPSTACSGDFAFI